MTEYRREFMESKMEVKLLYHKYNDSDLCRK